MYDEQLFEFYDQGRLAGVLHLPRDRRPCPIVIYCPGKNGERYEVHRLAVKFARYLGDRGIGFLRFDYYGLGLSDGFYHNMTTSTKVSNCLAAYKFALSMHDIDASRIAFLGFSDGCRVALMAARRTGVSSLLLWSPLFYEFGGNFPNGKRPRFTRHPEDPGAMVMPWAGLWVGMPFYRDLQTIDIHSELSGYQGRSLIVYGEDDPLLEEEFELLGTRRYGLYRGDGANEVEKVERAGHLFTSVRLENRLMDVSGEWLARTFGSRTAGERS